jgi:hypothetical protein
MTGKVKIAPPRVRAADSRHVRPPEKRADPFYLSAEWRSLMAEITRERGRRCEDPDHDPLSPREGVRVFGDHIQELRDGGAPLDKRNIMLRCGACHGRKTAAARSRRLAGP